MHRHYTHRDKLKQRSRSRHHNGCGLRQVEPAEREQASAVAGYQDRIIELERTITQLDERLHTVLREDSAASHLREHYHELFQHAPAGYVLHDSQGYLIECNWVAMALLGLKRRPHAGTTLAQFVAKSDLPQWLAHLRQCAATRQFHSVELVCHDGHGHTRPVRLLTQPHLELYGRRPGSFYTLILDITQRRATEAALRETQADHLRLIDAVEGIVWEADAHTLDVTFVSRHAERLLGYPAADWQRPGFWLNRIHHADRERVANEVLRAVARRSELRTEYRVMTAQRQVLWLHDRITVVDQGGRLKLLGVALDVTQQRQAQEQLHEVRGRLEQSVQERTAELHHTVAELEGFSYSISHDLRAPLRAMMGFAELAIKVGGEQLPPRSKEFMERVMEGAQRADRLVQDLLSYSRVSRANFKLEPVNLEKLVLEVLHQSPQFQPPQAEIKVKGPLLPVLGHEMSLSQAITNLLSNAVKFVPPGKAPCVQVCTERVEGYVRLWVEDNGIGIEPRHLARIFGIFERIHSSQRYEGTGIGLAIVRKGVERMGGRVGVESTPGKGSAFWIELKAATPDRERTNP